MGVEMNHSNTLSVMFLTVGSASIGGLIVGLMFYADAALANKALPTHPAIFSERFVLVDKSGLTRAELGVSNGLVGLQMADEDGKRRVWLGIGEKGTVDIAFMDNEEKTRARLGIVEGQHGSALYLSGRDAKNLGSILLLVDTDGNPIIDLKDEIGISRVNLSVTNKGPSGLTISHENGVGGNVLSIAADGAQALNFFDKHNKSALAVGRDETGLPAVVFSDASGVPRAMLGLANSGNTALEFFDRNSQARSGICIHSLGQPEIYVKDANGKTIWIKP